MIASLHTLVDILGKPLAIFVVVQQLYIKIVNKCIITSEVFLQICFVEGKMLMLLLHKVLMNFCLKRCEIPVPL